MMGQTCRFDLRPASATRPGSCELSTEGLRGRMAKERLTETQRKVLSLVRYGLSPYDGTDPHGNANIGRSNTVLSLEQRGFIKQRALSTNDCIWVLTPKGKEYAEWLRLRD